MAVGDDRGVFDLSSRGFHDSRLQRDPDERPGKLANLHSDGISSKHAVQQGFICL
jgi:hypothetical protein